MANLEVSVVGCTKLKDTEMFSRQDPYVRIEYGSSQYTTKTDTDGGRNPSFNEKFPFTVVPGVTHLNCVVMNSNTLTRDDFIGKAQVPLATALATGYEDNSFPLMDNKRRGAGYVRLVLRVTRIGGGGVGGGVGGALGGANQKLGNGWSSMSSATYLSSLTPSTQAFPSSGGLASGPNMLSGSAVSYAGGQSYGYGVSRPSPSSPPPPPRPSSSSLHGQVPSYNPVTQPLGSGASYCGRPDSSSSLPGSGFASPPAPPIVRLQMTFQAPPSSSSGTPAEYPIPGPPAGYPIQGAPAGYPIPSAPAALGGASSSYPGLAGQSGVGWGSHNPYSTMTGSLPHSYSFACQQQPSYYGVPPPVCPSSPLSPYPLQPGVDPAPRAPPSSSQQMYPGFELGRIQ